MNLSEDIEKGIFYRSLKHTCETAIANDLNNENLLSILEAAVECNGKLLYEDAIGRARQNIENISGTKAFSDLLYKYPKIKDSLRWQ